MGIVWRLPFGEVSRGSRDPGTPYFAAGTHECPGASYLYICRYIKSIPKPSQNDAKTIPKRSRNDPKTIPKRSQNFPKTIPKQSQNPQKTVPKPSPPTPKPLKNMPKPTPRTSLFPAFYGKNHPPHEAGIEPGPSHLPPTSRVPNHWANPALGSGPYNPDSGRGQSQNPPACPQKTC